jgi:ribosome modulation factor
MTKIEYGLVACIVVILIAILAPAVTMVLERVAKSEAAYEAAYDDGYAAGEIDMDIYAAPEKLRDIWKKGWRDAQTGKQSRFRVEDYR